VNKNKGIFKEQEILSVLLMSGDLRR